MASLATLPNELLLQVVECSDQSALRDLCLTSRLLHSVAQNALYRSISIGNADDHHGRPIDALFVTLLRRPSLAEKVRSLDIQADSRVRKRLVKGRVLRKNRTSTLSFVNKVLFYLRPERHVLESQLVGALLARTPHLETLKINLGNSRLDVSQDYAWVLGFFYAMKALTERGHRLNDLRSLHLEDVRGLSWRWFEVATGVQKIIMGPQVHFHSFRFIEPPAIPSTARVKVLRYDCRNGVIFPLIHPMFEQRAFDEFIGRTQLKALYLTNCDYYFTRTWLPSMRLNFTDVVSRLFPLAGSLEVLGIEPRYDVYIDWLHHVVCLGPGSPLKHFHHLRKICVPQQAFTFTEGSALSRDSNPRTRGLHEVLPTGIEVITIYNPTAEAFPLLDELQEFHHLLPNLKRVELHVKLWTGLSASALASFDHLVALKEMNLGYELVIIDDRARKSEL